MLAPVYLGLPLGALVGIHQLGGREGVLAIIATVAASDTFQFYTGRTFGRRPLAPTISPKKTIEGAIGGLVLAPLALVAIAYAWLPRLTPAAAWAAGVGIVIAGITGDLFESALKRAAGVKDSGTLIPGHGGVLDRIDALLFAAPIFYLVLRARMTRVAILGATGSIGTSALAVAEAHPDRVRVVGLAAGQNVAPMAAAVQAPPAARRVDVVGRGPEPAGGDRRRAAAGRRRRRRGPGGGGDPPRGGRGAVRLVGDRRPRSRARRHRRRQDHRAGQQGSAGHGRRPGDGSRPAPAACRSCRSTASTTPSTSACTAIGRPMSAGSS